jgi:hypothetical protein
MVKAKNCIFLIMQSSILSIHVHRGKIITKALLIFTLFSMPFYGLAQESKAKLSYGISLNESLSHTGINSGITGNVRYKNFEAYGGPEMALSDSYYTDDPRMGFTLGLRYFTNNSEKSSSFVFLNYQRVYYRPYLEDFYPSTAFNRTSEFVGGLGQEWKLYKKWHVGLSMGYGKYFDVFHDLPEGKKAYFDDGTLLIRFSTTYKFQ